MFSDSPLLCSPSSAQPYFSSRAHATSQGHLPGPLALYGRGQQLAWFCLWLLFLEPFPPPPPSPPLCLLLSSPSSSCTPPQWKNSADWRIIFWGDYRPQIPIFLTDKKINEALRVVSGLELISVLALARTAQHRETDKRLQSFGHAALCVTCQFLFVIICAQWCRSHTELLPGIWLFAVVKCRSLDLSEQRVKSWSVLQEQL